MTPARRTLLRGVHLLEGPDRPPRQADVWIEEGHLGDLTPAADAQGIDPGDSPGAEADTCVIEAQHCWLGPPLVDPHSVLEEPCQGRAETLDSLAAAAAEGGYGTVALLPWGEPERDRAETLDLRWSAPLRLLLWGSFARGQNAGELADHHGLLQAGAIGLAGGAALPPLALLERGLRLAEMGDRPLLLAPRDPSLSQQGFVRERVEALRAGWPIDPVVSETLPLASLLALQAALPAAPLRLMNLSTAEAVDRLAQEAAPPPASVCWWHLLADSGSLDPAAPGWRVEPSLGSSHDREALIEALERGLISAVAVHHQPLDSEEMLLSLEQRRPGVAGHGVAAAGGSAIAADGPGRSGLSAGFAGVLPCLWRELVIRRGWSPHRLWQRLCWGPASFLGLEPEPLQSGSRRWILFDPQARSLPPADGPSAVSSSSLARNHPSPPGGAAGAIVASGLRGSQGWWAPEAPRF